MRVALDAMGGDKAPQIVVSGAAMALQRHPGCHFLFFGDANQIQPLIDKTPNLSQHSTIIHTDVAISPEEKPARALRPSLKESSMRLAIQAVKEGKADFCVSAGNTGALMALSKLIHKTITGVHRPAMISFFPTLKGESAMLDLGANLTCDANNLAQFGVMGSAFAKAVLGVRYPTVGLLNVGSEDQKGHASLQEAATKLSRIEMLGEYKGFVEGDDVAKGTVDVIVTDGFTGNVALKMGEGTAKLTSEYMRRTFRSSLLAQIGYLFAFRAIRKLRHRLDPRRYNGAIFLGLNGITVKSHGGTDAFGFSNAIGVGLDLVREPVTDQIRQAIQAIEDSSQEVETGSG